MTGRPPWVPPAVPSVAYDERYFRTRNWGHAEWVDSEGASFSPIYRGVLARADLRPGEVVVDLGSGRGELVVAASEIGADRAVGIDYASAASHLASRTLAQADRPAGVAVVQGDARAVPLADGVADLVTLIDVVEHLDPPELLAALGEARRVLRVGGRVLAHTMPNRLIYTVTYRALRTLAGARRGWPVDPRNDDERRLHRTEHTARSLVRAFRASGLDPVVERGRFVYTDFVPGRRGRRIYELLARNRITRGLAVADLWVVATRT